MTLSGMLSDRTRCVQGDQVIRGVGRQMNQRLYQSKLPNSQRQQQNPWGGGRALRSECNRKSICVGQQKRPAPLQGQLALDLRR